MRKRLIMVGVLLGLAAGLIAGQDQALADGPPTVSAITPMSGPSTGSTFLNIYGIGFQPGAQVSVGGQLATSVTWLSAAQLTAVTPAGFGRTVPVTVINPDGQSGSYTGFTYNTVSGGSNGGLWVAGINPPSGDTGTLIHITGAAFSPSVTVSFGGVPGTNVVWLNQGYLMVSVPTGAVSGPITVMNPTGETTTSPTPFTYTGTGTATNTGSVGISSVSPNSTSAGNAITISGYGFQTGATVNIGGYAALNVSVVNSTLITATAPAGPTGLATVVVTNPGGVSTSYAGVTYPGTGTTTGASPSVASVSPNTGSSAGGTVVSISGSNFVSPVTVTFGGVPATNVTVASPTLITATTPANPVGVSAVLVSTASGAVGGLTSGFTYELAWPRVTSVSPSTGALGGGTTLTIAGTGFAPGATVTVGGLPAATVSSVSPTQIIVTTPPGASGPAAVVVTNPGGAIAGLASAFSYSANPQTVPTVPTPVPTPTPAPTSGTVSVTGVSPSSGPSAGGTAIVINGSGFQSGATVTISGISVPGTLLSSTQIAATTPAVTGTGSVTVTVTNPSGASASLSSAFTYGGSSTGGTTGGSTGTGAQTPGAGGSSGAVPPGGGLFVFGGGTNDQLVAAAGCKTANAAYWTTTSTGEWVGYVPSVPIPAVNAAWNTLFAGGIPAATPIFARC